MKAISLIRTCLAAVASVALGLPAAAQAPTLDSTKDLDTWLRGFQREDGRVSGRKLDQLHGLLLGLKLEFDGLEAGPERKEVFGAVLELLGAGLVVEAENGGVRPPATAEVCDLAEAWIDERIDGDLRRWIGREVLVIPRAHPPERRLAGVHVLAGTREREDLMPLLFCARRETGTLRRKAAEALVGWNEESVHRFFMDSLESPPEGLDGRGLPEQHFLTSGTCRPGRTAQRILAYLMQGLMADNWRRAAAALRVAPALPDPLAVPNLIEGLRHWRERGEQGEASKRIEYGIAAELERRSGRPIGLHPERWATWWEAVKAGNIAPPWDEEARPKTKAGFFGLRPTTDRVTFVIDGSGSMESPFAGEGGAARTNHSRYAEAIEQMESYLRAAGPETRFDIVVFSHGSRRWRTRLVPASDENLAAARRWLSAQRPDGGTQLRGGVEVAMRLSPNGRVNLDRLEADTVIVLCDGATDEGPLWVRPFLARTQDETRMVFHGVQIGGSGDGTLEQLSSLSGGEFVRVKG